MAEVPEARSFGAVAPHYDVLMRSVPYRMWAGYYLLLLSQQDAHPKRILDVACGTGAMTELLHAEGFSMAGVDLSAPMIEEARRKAEKKGLPIDYHVGDAAEFDLGETFDAALCFFDSLNNILDPARLEAAFRRVAAHLPPGGSWIFDLNTAYAFEEEMFDQRNLRKNAALNYEWKGTWDEATQTITVRMEFWKGNERFQEVHVQRAYDPIEVRNMLRRSGFRDVRMYHSYTLDPPRAKSDRIHFTALRDG